MSWIQSLSEESRRFFALILLVGAGIFLVILFITSTRSSISSISLTKIPEDTSVHPISAEELKNQGVILSPFESIAESLKNLEERARSFPDVMGAFGEKKEENYFLKFAKGASLFLARAASQGAEIMYGVLGREVVP